MKITNVEALHLRLPGVQGNPDGYGDTLLVRVSTDTGITGWGEVDASPHVARAVIEAPSSHACASGLRHLLVGQDPLDADRLWSRMYEGTLSLGRGGVVVQAMAGVDLALWDIRGQVEGEPVHRLLNGGGRGAIRVCASSLFQATPEATAEEAREARDAGFTAVKFGWKPFEDPEGDRAFLEAVRREVGDEVELMLDVGHAWDARTTLERARLFEPYDPFWIEEPLHPDDLLGYAEVSRECPIPIAAGGEECTVAGFDRLMELGGIDVVRLDPARVGLTQGVTVAMLAQGSGLPVVNPAARTDINAAAALHLLASVPNAFIFEYGREPGEVRCSLARNPIEVVDGHARVPADPGLGVVPDPALLDRYLVPA